jgi:hypothetical protein
MPNWTPRATYKGRLIKGAYILYFTCFLWRSGFMKTKVTLLAGLIVGVVALSTGFMTQEAKADSHDAFGISVYHGINGRSLGLSKELPVVATVSATLLDGSPLVVPLDLEFKDRLSTSLPAGEYTIDVVSTEAGPLPSMTVGPVFIPAGVDVSIHARLSGGKTPILSVRVK